MRVCGKYFTEHRPFHANKYLLTGCATERVEKYAKDLVTSCSMIEIEKKVILSEKDLQKIEQRATFLHSRLFSDTYYDTPDYRYTTNDIWLRERECQFELKIGIKNFQNQIDRYEELTSPKDILTALGLEPHPSLPLALEKAHIFPYASFQTVRRKYKIEPFTLDLDLAYFDDFIYRIAEIELIVHRENQMEEAEAAIESFIQEMGLNPIMPVRAKLIEFLSQKNPTHYRALQASGIVE